MNTIAIVELNIIMYTYRLAHAYSVYSTYSSYGTTVNVHSLCL
jgi:hypothetical protein